MKDSWNLIRPAFLYLLQNKPEGEIQGVEIGVFKGKNAAINLAYCDRLKLELVDIVQTPEAIQAMEPYKDRINFHIMPSVEAAKLYSDNYFDFIYIDGAHDYDNVLADITAWWPKIKKEGIFSGHDWWFVDVRKAVAQFFGDKNQRLYAVMFFYAGMMPSQDAEMCDFWMRVE